MPAHSKDDKIPGSIFNLTNKNDVWDNGLYISGFLHDVPADFLVDSGSTCTVISNKLFTKISPKERPVIKQSSRVFKNVNNQSLKVYGSTKITVSLEGTSFSHEAFVADIMPDAIIGQDFLLKYANKIDLKKLQLITYFGNIPCWIGGETKMICNVKPVRSTTVPPKSRVWLPVNIPSSEKLAPLGIIEPCLNQLHQKSIFFSAGIIDLRDNSTTKCIDFMNLGNEPVTLYPNSCIGTCESYYETVLGQCGAITTEIKDEAVLPYHLQDLYERSIVHLTEKQKADLKSLLIKYQDIFSKSSQDIGQTNAVQHRINTGAASPIRQPPRRLPFGKREIEKEEIQKMLKKGVIEPSSSPWSSCIVLVNKRDGTTRFCVDYRKLNRCNYKRCLSSSTC
ncbi:hypothetical protein FSP39_002615 [Pinctada imbricata]|uniref:Peptidase A2 domain-containing protein n=1 Tax=Pinctada imbricata TaxID=66713 RepID=A0AA88XGX9_PINIB|nr:hypothetical protein FSP39_002615 [Pinctada imbricata]